MALGDAWKQISWFYYQYLLVTALYMLEPWERTVFNSLLISVAAMAVYTGFVFMPQHIMAILHYFEKARPSTEDDNERTGDLLYRQMAEYSADHIPEEEPCSTPNGTDGMEKKPGERRDNFLGEKLGDRILQEVRRVHEDGSMQDGQLACQTLGQTKAIRGDKIAWVEGTETGCHNIGVLLSRIDKLITFADGQLGSYKIRGRHKMRT
ncbi:hypothetical protein KOW79_008296 [Hemibagrus wyckioides]|uniref:Uncharacterized protein n=1 Tax=Hemibagrus wyckioides TaxID=337641 RepID=A0A9D3NWV0_9TELE|nr:hypothetical protein KOW79_008296 [Hemibagrus wyckioides]